jgi:hypothetical protein
MQRFCDRVAIHVSRTYRGNGAGAGAIRSAPPPLDAGAARGGAAGRGASRTPAGSAAGRSTERGTPAAGLRIFPQMRREERGCRENEPYLQDNLGHAVACWRSRELASIAESDMAQVRPAPAAADQRTAPPSAGNGRRPPSTAPTGAPKSKSGHSTWVLTLSHSDSMRTTLLRKYNAVLRY